MCTSVISNRKKTIIGFNLDILGMEYRVNDSSIGVFIEINDDIEGWMPLFGVNNRGDFVAMPTCYPFDDRCNPKSNSVNIINLDIDLLTKVNTFEETKSIVTDSTISSIPGICFMSNISNKNGDLLQIIPGQGYNFYERPKYNVLTNFSPFKMEKELHPWMGLDRYKKAVEILSNSKDDFGVHDCFKLLKEVSQTVCPTVVSMVFDASEMAVYWCLERQYDNIYVRNLV